MHSCNRNITGLTPQSIPLTLLDGDDKANTVWCDVIAPYELFHWLWKEGDFDRSMLSNDTSLTEYWTVLLSHNWAASHPLKNKEHLWPLTVPIVYFTDGAEFSKSSCAEGLSL